MFESTEDALELIGLFTAAGFLLAVLYNILRFFRIAFPEMKKTAIITDFLFCIIAGLAVFIMSVEYGSGFFRLYYIISASFGFTLNMLTVGFAVPPLARLTGRAVKWFCKKLGHIISVPYKFACEKATNTFVKVKKYMSNITEKSKKSLKNVRRMMYNNYNRKIGEVYSEGGEHRNAVKAKVRKII
ncbi:MAG: spore cortex biosynthesis protein YabQ [Ruminiclostridium sp.]|nr:spore cortex biosynthesis protein YabQ [Ruminiclostridium sp.]